MKALTSVLHPISGKHFLCPLWVSFREWVAEIGMAQQPEELAAVVSIAAL